MFGGRQPNPYDDVVTKTTDENLTSENWELIMNLCDKVNDEGEQGARNVMAAVLKRLAHRNPNVQLYALALAESLSKNCGIELHREMASRSFTQGLEKLVTDRMTHEKVKRRALHLISLWSGEFENNTQLGMMEELYNTLKSKNFKFDQVTEPPPREVDDEARRKEEEELQRVLEMSVHDKGGRNVNTWKDTSSSNNVGASSSTNVPVPSSSGGYTPTEPPRSAYSVSETHHVTSTTAMPETTAPATKSDISGQPSVAAASEQASSSSAATSNTVTRVRALHTFEPTVAGELAFEKGDIIKVTDRAYDNWWRGQLRGRTGIFPVNYVEPLPELTPSELAREAEQEAAVFAQAANIDKLINMLRGLDPAKDNLADNEEIQELYRSSMSLRPKIVKLIDKYSQKRAELVAMNESFVKARGVFEQMMEDSLARHTGVYDNTQPTFRVPRPESRANAVEYQPATYGWNPALYDQPGYNAYPAAPAAYNTGEPQHAQQPPYPGPAYGEPNAYGGSRQPSTYGAQMQSQGPQPYAPVDTYTQQQQQVQPPQGQTPAPQQPQPYGHAAAGSEHSQPYGHGAVPTDPAAYALQNQQLQSQSQSQPLTQPHPQPHSQPESQSQSQSQPQVQAQPQVQTQPQPQAQPQAQAHPQAQAQPQPQPQPHALPQAQPSQVQTQQGPPYVYDPNTQYADPNVQAWAQYYAQGGNDMAGAVYFISVPGVTDASAQTSGATASGYAGSQAQNQLSTPAGMPSDQPSTHSTSPPTVTQAQPGYPAYSTASGHAASPPAQQAQLAQHPTQEQSAYQTTGAARPHSTSPSADKTQHPNLHIQPGYQPPNSVAQAAPQDSTQNVSSAAPYGQSSVSTSYVSGAYATRGPASPQESRPGYQSQGMVPPTSVMQHGQSPPVTSEGVGV